METWKYIPGYEGLYEASSLGNIKRCETGLIFSISGNSRGYGTVRLINNDNKKTFLVHRLVALAFLPKVGNLSQINHKNLNRLDNRVENLEWCNQSVNMQHRIQKRAEIGLPPMDNSKRNWDSKCKRVLDVSTGIIYKSAVEAANKFGMNARLLRRRLRGELHLRNRTSLVYL